MMSWSYNLNIIQMHVELLRLLSKDRSDYETSYGAEAYEIVAIRPPLRRRRRRARSTNNNYLEWTE